MVEAYLSYTAAQVVVGTAPVEAKTTATRNHKRRAIILHNASANVVHHGPTGLAINATAIPIGPGETVTLQVGDVAVFLVSASPDCNVIVQELA